MNLALQLTERSDMRIGLLLSIIIFVFPAWANPVPEFPFVIVTETLDKKVKPDYVKIRFNLLAYESSSEKAIESLSKSSIQILKVLQKYEITDKDIKSTQIDKNTKRARKDGAYNLDILGYEVTQGFNVELENLSNYPEIMNGLVKLDGVQNLDAFFETKKRKEYQDEMIVELSQKAREKADALAQAQARKVKSVYGITTEGTFGQAYAVFALEFKPSEIMTAYDVSKYGMDLIMSVPEYIEVNQRITAIYELK